MKSDVLEAIAAVESLGGEFAIEGTRVLVEYPPEQREAIASLIEKLRAHRGEVAIAVRERTSGVCAPATCPMLPSGVRLIRYSPRTLPVVVRPCSVVTDMDKFIGSYLRDLQVRLQHPEAYACAPLSDILSKLADAGVELKVDSP